MEIREPPGKHFQWKREKKSLHNVSYINPFNKTKGKCHPRVWWGNLKEMDSGRLNGTRVRIILTLRLPD